MSRSKRKLLVHMKWIQEVKAAAYSGGQNKPSGMLGRNGIVSEV